MSNHANSSAANSSAISCHWVMIEEHWHATIDGGPMLRIDSSKYPGQCVVHSLQLLTDRGWCGLHSIMTHVVANDDNAPDVNRDGATADLKAYAAFLYQGRVQTPLSTSELGYPDACLRQSRHGIRSYAAAGNDATKS